MFPSPGHRTFHPSWKVQGKVQRPRARKPTWRELCLQWDDSQSQSHSREQEGTRSQKAPVGSLTTCTIWPKVGADLRFSFWEVPSQAWLVSQSLLSAIKKRRSKVQGCSSMVECVLSTQRPCVTSSTTKTEEEAANMQKPKPSPQQQLCMQDANHTCYKTLM